ncbi:ras guanine nucleotide exchange factor domain-containing protein [Staphylotrichum tortipilum]|uniref:Ras guanine nucleotide exchange factor domain-containing protein n=1 Tax=Staphylotrichum tortipilum TaxID=2831512 RepID=A0AAN6RVL5_9PEZI|nr:ras guanine nucleotide exchange factor domain-containing protein [Staphylotrichum longicolle]
MLNHQGMRASLRVAPLTIQKTRGGPCGGTSEMTDCSETGMESSPATRDGSREAAEEQQEVDAPVESPPIFHNFLRAFYPFHPDYVTTDSTVTLPLNEGDVVLVHSIHTNGWADGTLLADGTRGWLPTNYCEAYDPEEMRSLLKALLNFWDLMRSSSIDDSEMFGNQEFMKGIIAGVRYLLEQTQCLTRESPLLQRHEGLRRTRKSLLSELSSLVKTAKRLLDSQRMIGTEDVNGVVDEMILKAFKIITKGVRFLDFLEDDRRSRVPAVTLMTTLLEDVLVPLTPPADVASFQTAPSHAAPADSRAEENGGGSTPEPGPFSAASSSGSAALEQQHQHQPSCNLRLSSGFPQATNPRRTSQNSLLQANNNNRLSSTVSHRVSITGLSSCSRPHNLVSERLNSCHDIFLSHLGSFIGRLQLQSQSRPSLALAIKQSTTSGGELLWVVDVVCAHTSISIDALEQARAAMYNRIQDLVHTARDILTNSEPDMEEDLIVPHDNGRLLGAATGCVKATGECVAKTRWIIERIGDFEFEFDNGSLDIDFGLSDLTAISENKFKTYDDDDADHQLPSIAEGPPSVAESVSSETPAASTANSVVSSSDSHARSLSIDKPLPEVPQVSSPVSEQPAAAATTALHLSLGLLAPPHAQTFLLDSDVSSVSSLRPDLPPLPKISTTALPSENYSPTEQSATRDGEFRTFRSESLTALSSGSGMTYLSRDSESSIVSQTSTRATTPDISKEPKNQPSLSSLADSTAPTEDEELECKLLEKTYAHELIFNKEGQVTGGSLPALVERLTTHESTPDALFVSTFYLTFRLFCTPVTLTEALIDRFDYVGEAPHIAAPVRLRTYNAFKGWLESHWREETDRHALPLIKQFAEHKLAAVLPSAGRRLCDLADKVSIIDGTLVPRLVSSMASSVAQYVPAETPLPAPVLGRSQANALANWKIGGTSPAIIDFDPLEIARQLTMKQMGLFCSITPDELLGSKWTKLGGADTPNVKAMSAFTTGLTNLVVDTILHHEEVKKRAVVIKHWIKIASHCSQLHNYDALMAITCALTDTSIKRLKMTWDAVPAKRKETLRALQATVDFNQNFKTLRAQLHDQVPPCLPFLGMFLTDLTFVDVGNPATKTSDTGLTVINFDKHARTAKSIGELQRFQIPYRLTELLDLQEWLAAQFERVKEREKSGANPQATHYRKSLLLEPRELQQLRTPIEAPAQPTGGGMFGWMRGGAGGQLSAQI